MTEKKLIISLLISLYAVFIFVVGCVPEDSLQWSQDGSVGLYSKNGALFLVNGNTGTLSQVEPNESTTFWPAISQDGEVFAYCKTLKVDDFNKALNQLRPQRVNLIKQHAEVLKQKIIEGNVMGEKFPAIGKMKVRNSSTNTEIKDDFNEQHVTWVQRYLVENADSQLTEKIGSELIRKTKEKELLLFQILVAPTNDLNSGKILASDSQMLCHVQFSPDSNVISWAANRISGDTFKVGFDLYVTFKYGQTPPVLVASAVAIGSDFRDDSRAVAYLKAEDENFDDEELVIGTLVERTIIGPDGELLVSAAGDDTKNIAVVRRCTGAAKELAGVIYYSWMKVSYGAEGRIFFSSMKMSLPSSKLDEEETTIFCYDTLTGAVIEILPKIAVDFTKNNCHLFDLSQDCREILLSGNENTVGIYALGGDLELSKMLVNQSESFGDDALAKLAPRWKGTGEISCLVSEKSHFLSQDPNAPHRRKEIIILDTEGNFKRVLSKDWPDELLDF